MTVDDRPGGRLLGVAALLAGLAGVVIGIGIGVRWVAAGVVTWQTILALFVLILGLILVVFGVRRLTRGLSRMAGFITGSLITLISIVLVWTFTPAVIGTFVPPPTNAASSIELGVEGGEARFTTADGVSLWGWYVARGEGRHPSSRVRLGRLGCDPPGAGAGGQRVWGPDHRRSRPWQQ
jgi:hypothetical protein